MKLLAVLLLVTLAAPPLSSDPQALVGTWSVDLRPTPDAPAYLQPMVLTAVDGDEIQGTFYGSPITQSEVNADWDGVRFAFTTSDGSAEYVTAGRLLDGVIEGTTYAPDRSLLQPWRAVRSD